MMNAVAGRRAAALSAVVALILLASEARAQAGGAADATATQAPPPVPAGPRGQNGSQLPPLQPGELDPSAPRDSWPGMDVEWPDMNQPDQPPPAAGMIPFAATQGMPGTSAAMAPHTIVNNMAPQG